VVSASNALRTCGLPALHVWDALLGRDVTLEFHEDNSTAVTAMKHGHSPAMKYLERTHGVCLLFLAERFIEKQCHLFYERSALMAADIYIQKLLLRLLNGTMLYAWSITSIRSAFGWDVLQDPTKQIPSTWGPFTRAV
jgi:hypothetical protein